MGTSTGWRQLSNKLERLGTAMGDNKAAGNTTGMAGKAIFLRHAAQAGVLGKKIAGKRKAIDAGYDLTDNGHGVLVFYKGPAHLVNNPTKAHRIEPRRPRGSRSRRRGRQALTIGGNVRASANHPGTAGKGFFQRAHAECQRVLPGVYGRAQITKPLKEIFR